MITSKAVYTFAILVCLTACGGENGPEERGGTAPEPEISAMQRASIDRVLDDYETIRAALAQDELGAVGKSAADLETAASDALATVPELLKRSMTELQAAAGRLKETDTGDPKELRRVFGDTSRPVVALLSAETSLRTGRFVLECPMAQGYKKWIQNSSQISNAYMGKAMPECGSPSEWTPDGGAR